MPRILLEEQLSLPCLPADFFWKVSVGLAELVRGAGPDQRRPSSGRVFPLRCSARASWARRRIFSLLEAKCLAQADSSSSSARICAAIASCSSCGRLEIFSIAFSSRLVTPSIQQMLLLLAISSQTTRTAQRADDNRHGKIEDEGDKPRIQSHEGVPPA